MTASSYILFDFSVGVNADRVKVLLSVLRHCPLIDANHSSSFMHLGDTHYEKNQNVNKKKQVLVIYGEDDGNHTFLLRFFFFRCDQIKKKIRNHTCTSTGRTQILHTGCQSEDIRKHRSLDVFTTT